MGGNQREGMERESKDKREATLDRISSNQIKVKISKRVSRCKGSQTGRSER